MKVIQANHVIDNARFGKFHWMVMAWCFLLLIFDGYDLFIYGVVLPTLMHEWQLSPLQAGAMGSYALFGMMFGAVLFGTLADQIGRKKGIVICCLIFSVATMLNGHASNPTEFGVCRAFAGLGCGGLMPNVVALMNEYSPKKAKSTISAVMFCGYPLGGVLAAVVAIYVLPGHGWQIMFYAAAIPLLLLPLIYWRLPESVGYLMKEQKIEEARRMLRKVDPSANIADHDHIEINGLDAPQASMPELFKRGRALRTAMLWVSFFCCMLMIYALSSWLPKLMTNAGYSMGSSISFLVALNLGAAAGAVAGGWLGDKLNLPKVLIAFLLLASVSVTLLGYQYPTTMLYLLIGLAGASTIGTQILLYACAAEFYELNVRSTGMGWASGVGRTGAVIGPLLGGYLLALGLPLQLNVMAFGVPGILAAACMFVFHINSKQTGITSRGLTTSATP